MVRSSTVDFWSVLGRWSSPIRQLWRIAGLVQEDGHVQYPVLCGFLEFSGKVDCQAPSDSFLEFFGKLVIPIPFHCTSAVSQSLNAYNGSDGNPGVLGVPGGLGSIGREGAKGITLSYVPLTMVTSGQLAPQVEGAPGTPGAVHVFRKGCN
eukprot:Em0002g1035a